MSDVESPVQHEIGLQWKVWYVLASLLRSNMFLTAPRKVWPGLPAVDTTYHGLPVVI